MYKWNWDWISEYRGQLIDASILTLELNIVIMICGTIIGLILCLTKRSKFQMIRILSILIIDIIRTLPVLVLLIWFYFCLPLFFQVKISAFQTAVIVFALNLGAFIAEIFNSGIESVPKIHFDYANLLGMSKKQTLRYIILPIAVKNMTPALVGQYINSIKLSVLASFIAVPELLNVTQDIISQTYRPLEFYTLLAAIFLTILLPGTIWSKKFELQKNYTYTSK